MCSKTQPIERLIQGCHNHFRTGTVEPSAGIPKHNLTIIH